MPLPPVHLHLHLLLAGVFASHCTVASLPQAIIPFVFTHIALVYCSVRQLHLSSPHCLSSRCRLSSRHCILSASHCAPLMRCRRLLLGTTTALPMTTVPAIGGGSLSPMAATAAADKGGGGPTAAPASAPNRQSAVPTLPKLRQHHLANDSHTGNRGRQPKASGSGGQLGVVVDGSG
jgi:hypothetical protein